ncbi:MAG: hypothetical protein ACR2IF_13655 [Terriglobales bacterium]
MLSKCANPDCSAHFHYLREGKLFQIDSAPGSRLASEGKAPHRIEYFWLCGDCASTMTLAYQPGRGVTAVPLPRVPLQHGAVAS